MFKNKAIILNPFIQAWFDNASYKFRRICYNSWNLADVPQDPPYVAEHPGFDFIAPDAPDPMQDVPEIALALDPAPPEEPDQHMAEED